MSKDTAMTDARREGGGRACVVHNTLLAVKLSLMWRRQGTACRLCAKYFLYLCIFRTRKKEYMKVHLMSKYKHYFSVTIGVFSLMAGGLTYGAQKGQY